MPQFLSDTEIGDLRTAALADYMSGANWLTMLDGRWQKVITDLTMFVARNHDGLTVSQVYTTAWPSHTAVGYLNLPTNHVEGLSDDRMMDGTTDWFDPLVAIEALNAMDLIAEKGIWNYAVPSPTGAAEFWIGVGINTGPAGSGCDVVDSTEDLLSGVTAVTADPVRAMVAARRCEQLNNQLHSPPPPEREAPPLIF